MSEFLFMLFDIWFKIYPLLCIGFFVLALNAGLRGGGVKIVFFAVFIIFLGLCFFYGGSFYGLIQSVFLTFGGGCYYYIGSRRARK